MILTRNFSFEEFIKSSTAKRNNIDNYPDIDAINNIKYLVVILQNIRDKYGKPIIIDSGYRCAELNSLLKGAKNSDHIWGAAVDIHSLSDSLEDNKELFDVIVEMANNGDILLRQIIDEYNYNWIHVSINHNKNPFKKNQIIHKK